MKKKCLQEADLKLGRIQGISRVPTAEVESLLSNRPLQKINQSETGPKCKSLSRMMKIKRNHKLSMKNKFELTS